MLPRIRVIYAPDSVFMVKMCFWTKKVTNAPDKMPNQKVSFKKSYMVVNDRPYGWGGLFDMNDTLPKLYQSLWKISIKYKSKFMNP